MEMVFGGNRTFELRLTFAGWQQVWDVEQRAREEARHMGVVDSISVLARDFSDWKDESNAYVISSQRASLTRSMTYLMNGNRESELRFVWASWIKAMEQSKKLREEEEKAAIHSKISALEENFNDSLDSHGRTRKDQLRRSMEIMFNNNKGVELRVAMAGWKQVMGIIRREREDERHLSTHRRID